MTLVRSGLQEIYAPVNRELKEFSGSFEKELESTDPLIQEINRHLLKMTGKFLRPVLVILSAKLEKNGRTAAAVDLAVAIELIHTATLIHDDIIDNSELRRNQPSIYFKWGREISIVAGDYLYAKAFLKLAGLKDVWVNQAFAACAELICKGEMKQIERRNHFLMSEEEYLKIIHQKTAALFQASCMGGAYFSGMGKEGIEKLGSYGFRLGMAFQIVDDCLDLVGETESLGKTVGLDIYKNDVTLPILYLFQSLGEGERTSLLEELKNPSAGLFDRIKELALRNKAVDRAMDRAREYIEGALDDLDKVKNSDYKESLAGLAHYCLERAR